MKTTIFLFISKLLAVTALTFAVSGVALCQVQYYGTVNTGNTASAINYETQATGDYSFASGYQSVASGQTSTAIGTNSTAYGPFSVAIGSFCYSESQSISIGQGAMANAVQSYAIGKYIETNASGAITLGSSVSGYSMVNAIPNSLMVGFNSTVPTLFISESEAVPGFNGYGKVGIGTTNPVARLQVADGDIFIQDINKGIIMKSPDGNCWRGTLNNNGQLEFEKLVDCVSLSVTKTNESQEKSTIKIFPNPASRYIDITCSDKEYETYNSITLYSSSGNKIITLPFTSTSTRLSLDNLISGSYVLTISGNHKSYSEIIIIK
jgi:autotransporter adhesin